MASGTLKAHTKIEVRKVKAKWVNLTAKGLDKFGLCPIAVFDDELGWKVEPDEHLLIISRSSAGSRRWVDYFLVDGDIREMPTSDRRAIVLVRGNEVGTVSTDILVGIARGDKLLEYAAYVVSKAWLDKNVC
jgi:hypothetical protein